MSKRRDGLQRAKNCKNDEFYTLYDDIVAECNRYLDQFRGKVIYCNCDTAESNFVRYFSELRMRGVVRSVIYSGGLGGDDFRSPASVWRLRQADIVVSNPPFSLFREYVGQLVEYNKRFLILGNQNAVSYKDLFPMFLSGQIRLGYRRFGSMLFDTPSGTKASVSSVWFTNLDVPDRSPLLLTKTYAGNESKYPKFDNIEAISVGRKSDIPCDYFGVMGVPITFLDRHNPYQFRLLGLDVDLTSNHDRCTIGGQRQYARIFIQRNVANDNMLLTKMVA